MSFQNKNLYDLLGNDVEDDSAAVAPVKEVVKKNTSSKKADVAPQSADPAKAKKKSKPTGNEGALKTKISNKEEPVPQSAVSKHQKKPFDRHSRSGKTDSKKKLQQGWGESDNRELVNEIEGAEDAEAELEAEEQEEVEVTPKKSLQEYLAEQQQKQKELDGAKKLRQANEGSEQKWSSEEKIEKQEEAYFASTHQKKTKVKAPKEKVFLEVEATFFDEKPQSFERNSNSRGGFRGGKRGGFRGGARRGDNFRGGQVETKSSFNEKDYPSL
ncbi:hypothetical protein KGF56_002143 [Candida oxycetoniae]|uniref:Hyaluronan/mRNA-binding protein domain-containing protein n=1 Tax=Candida oxycetoniae TaxID=497107 RepID=A0AAI9WYE7_9ASCO|nr:uncharacterized protein KGF56_002143 [Candida oxycetoniae]KAI3405058.1 hypothetical protein KGF56_002143 [Candida oxycetoniae]